jgi:hypothetical protein
VTDSRRNGGRASAFRARKRAFRLGAGDEEKGLRPVMSEPIRHGRLVARDGGEIQAGQRAAAVGQQRSA